MNRRAFAAGLLGISLCTGLAFAAKAPKKPRVVDPMVEAHAVGDSLAGLARWREGVTVRMREDRMPFCGHDGLAEGYTLLVEVADDASPRGVQAARDIEAWLRKRGWLFVDSCFAEAPVRRAAFTREALGIAFETSPLEREHPSTTGRYEPGYLLTLGIVVRVPIAR